MATVKAKIRTLVEKITKLHIYRLLPHGVDLLNDINTLLPKYSPKIIFDVGANIGQSSKQYIEWFPRAQVFCFEPVSSIFAELQKNMGDFDNIKSYHLAFSSVKGRADIHCDDTCSTIHPLYPDEICYVTENVENIELDTIDEFCFRENIHKIGLLKIDTEGHDLKVLRGAENMFNAQMIDIVQVEAGMNPKNTKFVPFEEFKNYLESRGYYLFGIYEQVNEHYTGEPHLRRINPVYISKSVIDMNRNR